MRRCIVMIHGMWAGGWVWDDWVPILERRGYACLAPTLRYHDVSPRTPPDALGFASLLDYAHDLEREIDSLAEPPILLGHSMGGILAQMMAARGRARAVALLSPMPPQGINVLSLASLRMFRRTLMSWGFWGRPTRPDFADAVASMLGHLSGAERRAVYDRLVHESGRVGCETGFWFLDPHRAKWVDASRVECPVLVLAGAEDRLHPPSMMRKVARRYERHSTYMEIPGHGHWLVGEPGWQEIAEHVADWLDEALAGSVQPAEVRRIPPRA
jgi:pimeloyl-ACP methyl ester carboxylesterase